jgi:large repetitive protein
VVDAAGNWRAAIPGGVVRAGTYVSSFEVRAWDAAQNTGTLTAQPLSVDTDAPTSPIVEGYSRSHRGISDISITTTQDQITLTEVLANGTTSPLNSEAVNIRSRGETLLSFGNVLPDGGFQETPLPDGSHLMITSTDRAGNTSGTFLAFDELNTSVINLSAPIAAGLRVDAIDLTFAEDSVLTLTEAQIMAMSPDLRTITVHGGSDDRVNIAGAVRDGTEVIEGRSYAVYDLGQTRVIIDEDVQRIY